MPMSLLAATVRTIRELPDDSNRVVEQLNDVYVQAYLESDAAAFDDLVAEDFLVTLSNGNLLNKTAFLRLMSAPTGVVTHRVEDLRIRRYDNTAIVNATTRFTRVDGSEGETRYTDVYAKRRGMWRAVSAHLTAVPVIPMG